MPENSNNLKQLSRSLKSLTFCSFV